MRQDDGCPREICFHSHGCPCRWVALVISSQAIYRCAFCARAVGTRFKRARSDRIIIINNTNSYDKYDTWSAINTSRLEPSVVPQTAAGTSEFVYDERVSSGLQFLAKCSAYRSDAQDRVLYTRHIQLYSCQAISERRDQHAYTIISPIDHFVSCWRYYCCRSISKLYP